jgi:hypothetical protein
MNIRKTLLVLLVILIASGCSTVAPQYQPDFNLVNELKDLDLPGMKSGEFTAANDSVNHISIRGGTMSSPFDNSYAEYLKKALEEELKQSSIWDLSSEIEITATLLKNELDASGLSIGECDLSANFMVNKEGSEIYNKVHSIHHEWESSFIGAIALPKAQQNYLVAIQKLLREFFLDQDLLSTLNQ